MIENEKQNRIFDLEAYRKDLAESNPETARWFEQTTTNEREETLKQIAMIEAMAHGVLWALGNLTDFNELSPRA